MPGLATAGAWATWARWRPGERSSAGSRQPGRSSTSTTTQPRGVPLTTSASVKAALVRDLGSRDSQFIEVVADAAALLGRALAGLHVGVGVERFLLIGGFACAAGESYRRQVVAAARTSCWDLGLDWDAAISIEGTGDDVALGGAWLAARDQGWV